MSYLAAEYSVKINASTALKLAKIAENNYPGTVAGPVYGFDDPASKTLNVSQLVAFPAQHSSSDDIFSTKGGNGKFQAEFGKNLNDSKVGVKLLGWFVSSVGGKYMRQTVIESLLHLQETTIKVNREDWPAFIIVYDPSKALDSLLSLKVLKLSEPFLKTWHSEPQFVAHNLIDNKLSYKKIFEEVPATIKNTQLTNLKIQQLDTSAIYGDDLGLSSNNQRTVSQTADQLTEAIDNFNHNLGNFNYYQRNLSREVTKITQWRAKAKQVNEEKLKANPKAKVSEPDWTTQFKLTQPPSKYENLVLGGLVNNLCENLETTGSTELTKVKLAE